MMIEGVNVIVYSCRTNQELSEYRCDVMFHKSTYLRKKLIGQSK